MATSWRKLAILIGLYALGVFFVFRWSPWDALFVFWPRPQASFLILFFLLIFFGNPLRSAYSRLMDQSPGRWMLAGSLISFVISTALALLPLESLPHTPDGICYLWQAKTFAMGRLFVQSHDLPEFFNQLFFINDGRWYSLFQPGFPFLMTVFVLLKIPMLLNPLLTAIAVVLVYPIGRRVFNDRTAKLGLLMLALSPMHLAIGATMLSHSFAMVLTELAVLFSLKLEEENRGRDAAILGAALGWLFLSRAMNGTVMVLLTMAFLLGLWVRHRITWRTIAVCLGVAFPFLCLQYAYNHALTGNALYWPQDRYFDTTEPKKGCHKPGFGKDVGCPIVHPKESFPNGFGPSDAVKVTHKRLGTFLLTLIGWNFLFLFIGASFLAPGERRKKGFLLAVFLSLLIGYFFFYFHGLWGRYYYESSFAIFLLIAAGLSTTETAVVERTAARAGLGGKALRSVVPAIGGAYFAFNLIFFFPALIGILGATFFGVDSRLEKLVHGFPEKSIIVLKEWYEVGFVLMGPDPAPTRYFIHDLGEEHTRQFAQYYPDWKVFRYNAIQDKTEELHPDRHPSPVYFEMEYKIPVVDSSGEFAMVEDFGPSKGRIGKTAKIMTLTAERSNSYFAVKQFVFEKGDYRMEMQMPAGPGRGRMQIRIDDHVCPEIVDQYARTNRLLRLSPSVCGVFPLDRGPHRIEFRVMGKRPDSAGYWIGADWVRLIRLERNEGGND